MPVRAATADDVTGIAAVHVSSWEGAYRGLLPDSVFERVTIELRIRQLDRFFADPPAGQALLVAEDGRNGVVGMAWVGPNRDDDVADPGIGELLAIYVAPAHWRMGHGRDLMIAALAELRSAGCHQATLWVLDTNRLGRRFYERGGWFADGAAKVDQSFGDPMSELRYRFDLGAQEAAAPDPS